MRPEPFLKGVIGNIASRPRVNCIYGIGATSGARWFVPNVFRGAIQISRSRRVGTGFFVFQGPGRFGAFDLFKVGNAGRPLAGGAGLDEVRNGNGGQQANDGHHNHDFHQRETSATDFGQIHNSYFIPRGVKKVKGGLTSLQIQLLSIAFYRPQLNLHENTPEQTT